MRADRRARAPASAGIASTAPSQRSPSTSTPRGGRARATVTRTPVRTRVPSDAASASIKRADAARRCVQPARRASRCGLPRRLAERRARRHLLAACRARGRPRRRAPRAAGSPASRLMSCESAANTPVTNGATIARAASAPSRRAANACTDLVLARGAGGRSGSRSRVELAAPREQIAASRARSGLRGSARSLPSSRSTARFARGEALSTATPSSSHSASAPRGGPPRNELAACSRTKPSTRATSRPRRRPARSPRARARRSPAPTSARAAASPPMPPPMTAISHAVRRQLAAPRSPSRARARDRSRAARRGRG